MLNSVVSCGFAHDSLGSVCALDSLFCDVIPRSGAEGNDEEPFDKLGAGSAARPGKAGSSPLKRFGMTSWLEYWELSPCQTIPRSRSGSCSSLRTRGSA